MKMSRTLVIITIMTAAALFFGASAALAEETGKPVKCQECSAAGIVKCGNCGGDGQAGSNNELFREQEKHCVKCNATGKRICKVCGGKKQVFEYPKADPATCGFLHMIFKVEAKKNKPAPSNVTLIIDGNEIATKTAEGKVRTFDFGKVPVSPGDNHRIEIKVFIKKGIAGYHHGRLYIHNVKIESGRTTFGEGGRKSLRLSDDTRVEDWGEEYTGLYLNTDETGSFKLVDEAGAPSSKENAPAPVESKKPAADNGKKK